MENLARHIEIVAKRLPESFDHLNDDEKKKIAISILQRKPKVLKATNRVVELQAETALAEIALSQMLAEEGKV